jgi:hypothetical protein
MRNGNGLSTEAIYKQGESVEHIDIDPNAPWWKSAPWVPTSELYVGLDAAQQALTIQAIFGGGAQRYPIRLNVTIGVSKGSEQTAIDEILGVMRCRLIRVKENGSPPEQFNDRMYLAMNDDGMMSVYFEEGNDVCLSVCSRDKEAVAKLVELLKKYSKEYVSNGGKIHTMVHTQQGVAFKVIGTGGVTITRDNYSKSVLEGYDRVVNDLNTKAPAGRISIFNGPAGCGKTYLVKAMLQEVDKAVFIIVPPHLLQSLGDPATIPAVVELRQRNGNVPLVFIIEDADECLATRSAMNMSAISSILNLSDGILGSMLDVRVIATTNAKNADIDKAILRPARLSAHTNFHELSMTQACDIYQRLTGKQAEGIFSGKTSLAKIYQMAIDAGWKPAPQSDSRPIGFNPKVDMFDY